jgi:hypothetical protein
LKIGQFAALDHLRRQSGIDTVKSEHDNPRLGDGNHKKQKRERESDWEW